MVTSAWKCSPVSKQDNHALKIGLLHSSAEHTEVSLFAEGHGHYIMIYIIEILPLCK